MSAATSHLSLEEFHRLYDGVKPYHEYWFGEAIPKPLATSLHSAVQVVLILLLRRFGWTALPEVTLKLVPDAEPISRPRSEPGENRAALPHETRRALH
jgi:Uma2 family endonuclease